VYQNQKQGRVQKQHVKYTLARREQVDTRDDSFDGDYDDVWPMPMPSSVISYQKLDSVRSNPGRTFADVDTSGRERRMQASYSGGKSAIPPRSSATQNNIPVVQTGPKRTTRTNEVAIRHSGNLDIVRDRSKPRYHWLVFVGMAMFIMLVGWVLLTMLANWWQVTQDDWHYGRPRTYQVDMVVGQNNDSPANPSHFIAINLNRHIEVIEFPGGDPSKAKIYVGPTLIGSGADLSVVTLTFRDVTGDGKLDMIVNVQGSHFVFINDNGQFRPARPDDKIQL
jgi:hypothetical protein